MTTDPTSEAVKAACATACKYPNCSCMAMPRDVKAAIAAFTAAQLAGAEGIVRELLYEIAVIPISSNPFILCVDAELAHRAASTISALRAENAALKERLAVIPDHKYFGQTTVCRKCGKQLTGTCTGVVGGENAGQYHVGCAPAPPHERPQHD